jgi:hypothetical protein
VDVEARVLNIYEQVDDLLRAGEFALVDSLLRGVDIDKAPAEILLAYLTITSAARDRLEARSGFFRLVRFQLKQTHPDSWEELLEGME